ncbi:MAG: tryptophan dimethylallyltransferase family protein [Streptosporangiaceae bacterium]
MTLANRDSIIYDVAAETYADFLLGKWNEISDSLGIPAVEYTPVASKIRSLLSPWGDWKIGSTCVCPTFVSADGFPAEISVNWSADGPELRIVFESLGELGTLQSNLEAGARLTRRLAAEPGVDLDWYLAVEHLFSAAEPEPGHVGIWHAIGWRPGKPLRYNVYLDLLGPGTATADSIAEAALDTLGFRAAWLRLADRLSTARPGIHRVENLSLTLRPPAQARLKVYTRNRSATVGELEDLVASVVTHQAGDLCEFYRAVLGREPSEVEDDSYTCLGYRLGSVEPVDSNTYLRIPALTANDEEAAAVIEKAMEHQGLDATRYLGLVQRIAPAELGRISGLQELLSFRCGVGRSGLTVYLRFPVYTGPRRMQ